MADLVEVDVRQQGPVLLAVGRLFEGPLPVLDLDISRKQQSFRIWRRPATATARRRRLSPSATSTKRRAGRVTFGSTRKSSTWRAGGPPWVYHRVRPPPGELGGAPPPLQQGTRWGAAVASYKRGLRLSRRLGDRHCEAQALMGLGDVYRCQGRRANAIAAYERSVAIWRELGDRREDEILGHLSDIYRWEGRRDDAIACYERRPAVWCELGDPYGEAQALMFGQTYQDEGRQGDAIAPYERSVNLWGALGKRGLESTALECLRRAYESRGRHDEAIACSSRSQAISRELRVREELERRRRELEDVDGAPGARRISRRRSWLANRVGCSATTRDRPPHARARRSQRRGFVLTVYRRTLISSWRFQVRVLGARAARPRPCARRAA
jgi:Tetratricopeptide repeat